MSNDLITFTRGNPAPDAFPIETLSECAEEIFRREGRVIFQYGHYSGYAPLREWIANRYAVNYERVLLGNGSMEFMTFLSAAFLEDGDTVFLENPSYDRSITAMKRAGARVVGIPVENDGIDIEKFKESLKHHSPKFFYTVPDFQNPTGITTSLEKRETIVQLAREHGFLIIEDTPYQPLRYYGSDIVDYRTLLPEQVFHISSFSKLLSPGLRVGLLIGPESYMPTLHKWTEDTYIHPNLVAEGIVYEFCRNGHLMPQIERLKELYRPRLDGISASLNRHLAGKADWTTPQGGFFVSVFLPDNIDGAALQANAKDFGLVLSSGSGFFVDGAGDNFLRLPFCQMDPDETEEGIKRLSTALSSFAR